MQSAIRVWASFIVGLPGSRRWCHRGYVHFYWLVYKGTDTSLSGGLGLFRRGVWWKTHKDGLTFHFCWKWSLSNWNESEKTPTQTHPGEHKHAKQTFHLNSMFLLNQKNSSLASTSEHRPEMILKSESEISGSQQLLLSSLSSFQFCRPSIWWFDCLKPLRSINFNCAFYKVCNCLWLTPAQGRRDHIFLVWWDDCKADKVL